MPDGGKKLLVPGAKQDWFSLFQQMLPFFFIDDLKAEGQTVNPDKVIGKNNKGAGINKKF